MKYNVDPSELVTDNNHLVSPDYSPEPDSQEPNPFAKISWQNPESQQADESFEAGLEVTTMAATIVSPSPTNGLLEAESIMPAYFVDPGAEPPRSLALAAATMTMPGAPRITVGLSLAELQGAATVGACLNSKTGTLELVVRRIAGDV